MLANLLQQCGLGPGAERDTVIDSILDWRDPNRDHRLNGAEEDYYRGLDPPYSCKDGPFDVVEELLLVRGVTPRLFAGGEVDGKKSPGCATSSPPADRIRRTRGRRRRLSAKPAACRRPIRRTARPTAVSEHFVIIATGKPAGGGPPRSLRAVVLREDDGDSRSFTLVYWNDSYIPE